MAIEPKYIAAINAYLQGLQADRLLNVHASLTKLVEISKGEQQRLARAALADLEEFVRALNREKKL